MLAQIKRFSSQKFGLFLPQADGLDDSETQSHSVAVQLPSSRKCVELFLKDLNTQSVSESTRRNYSSDILQFIEFSADDDIQRALSEHHFKAFFADQQHKGLKSSTIQRKIVSLKLFSQWVEKNYLHANSSIEAPTSFSTKVQHHPQPSSTAVMEHPVAPSAAFPTQTFHPHAFQDQLRRKIQPGSSSPSESSVTPTPPVSTQRFVIAEDLPATPASLPVTPTETVISQFAPSSSKLSEKKSNTNGSNDTDKGSNKKGYQDWILGPYFHLATLVVFFIFISILWYRQFFVNVPEKLAYPASPVTPDRILSFQARLTDAAGSPITTATNTTFRLYTASSGGSLLWNSGTCSIDPDQDGIFSTILGSTCGSAIDPSVFTENSEVWLEITVVSDTLTPRQRIATVPFALNSETVQGFPVNSTVSATRSTLVVMNQWGEILIGEQSPQLRSVSGTFTISGSSLSLTTTAGDINISPAGNNVIFSDNSVLNVGGAAAAAFNFFADSTAGNTTAAGDNDLYIQDILEVDGAARFDGSVTLSTLNTAGGIVYTNGSGQLLTSAAGTSGECLQSGGSGAPTWTSCGSGGTGTWRIASGAHSPVNDTLDLLVGSNATMSAKFAVINVNSGTPTASLSAGAAGGAYLTATGTLQTTANQTLTLGGSTTGDIEVSPLNGGGGVNFNLGAARLLNVLTGNLKVGNAAPTVAQDGEDAYIEGTLEADGAVRFDNASITLSTFTNNGGLLYTNGSGVVAQTTVGSAGECLQSIGGGTPTWGSCGSSSNYWRINNGGLSPVNDTLDFLIGNTATTSAKFAVINVNSGTPIASLSAGAAGGTFITAAGSIQTTASQALTLGGADTGDISLLPMAGNGGVNVTLGSSRLLNVLIGNFKVGNGTPDVTQNGEDAYIEGTLEVDGAARFDSSLTVSTLNTAGGIVYTNGSGQLLVSTAGSTDDCLKSGGTGAPTWGSCTGGGLAGTWRIASGAHSPVNDTLDLLVGSNATTSAKFAVINVDSGTPTASLSAGAAGGAYLTAAGTLQTTANQSLTLGGDTTGDIAISPLNGSGGVNVNLGAPRLFNILAGSLKVGNGSPNISQDGEDAYIEGTLEVDGGVRFDNASITMSTFTTNGGLLYTNGSGVLAQTGAGNSGECLKSNGGGAPTFGDCVSGATNYWRIANGGLSPVNDTLDLLVGSNATTSAKFAVINVNSGNPTATLSAGAAGGAYLSSTGTLQTTANQALTVGGNTTGDISFSPLNGSGTSTFNGGLTQSGGTVNLNVSSNNAVNIGTGTSTGTITLGGNGTQTIGVGNGAGNKTVTLGSNNTGSTTAIQSGTGGLTLNSTSSDIALSTNTSGNINATTAQGTGLFNVLTGNLKVGNGTPDVTQNGEDAYIEGTLEVDGALRFDNSSITLSSFTANGGLLYTNGSGVVSQTAVGNSGECLTSSGGGAPVWASCSASSGNFWRLASGALSPVNDTVDFLIGNTATMSAKFAVINVNSGTPTASLSAGAAGGAYLTATGTLQTTANQALTIGGNTTGDLTFSPLNGSGTSTFNGGLTQSGGVVNLNVSSNNAVNIGTGTSTGTVTVGGTGTQTISLGNGAGNKTVNLGSNSGTSTTAILSGSGGLSLNSTSSDIALQTNTSGNITATTAQGAALFNILTGNLKVGNGTPTVSQDGEDAYIEGTLEADGAVRFDNSSITLSTFTTNGGLLYTNGSGVVAQTAAGSSGECLKSNGGGAPTFGVCATDNYWRIANGAISPVNDTLDLLIGNTATTSAKFAVINVNSGTPTASLSAGAAGGAYLTAAGTLQTTANQTMVLGGNTTGNISLSPLNGQGTVSVASDLSSVARSTDLVSLTQANDGTRDSTAQLLQLTNSDTASTVSLLDIAQNGVGGTGITFTSNATGTLIDMTPTTLSSGIGLNILASGLTSGSAINMSSTTSGAGLSAFTGNVINVALGRTYTGGGTLTDSGSFLNLARTGTQNTGAGTYAMTGDVAKITSTCSASGGACTDSSHILTVQQNFASATGSVFDVTNAGTGVGIQLTSSSTGDLMHLDSSGAVTTPNGLSIAATNGSGVITDAIDASDAEIVNALNVGANTITGAGYLITSTGSGLTVNSTAGDLALTTTTSGNFTATPALAAGLFNILTGNLKVGNGTPSVAQDGEDAYIEGVLEADGAIRFDNSSITLSSFTTDGGLLYTNGSGVLAQTAQGSLGECLQSAAGGSPTWGSCGGANYWRLATGALSPVNDTLDLLVGSNATMSAKFAVLNVNNGTPTASLSAGAAGGAYLTATGTLQTTANQRLTLGGNTTGDVTISPRNGAGTITLDHSGITTTNGTTVSANALTTGAAFIIPHTTSVIANGGSLARISSTSVDTSTTTGVLLDLSSSASTAGTQFLQTYSALTTGIGQSTVVNALTTGTAMRLSSSSTGITTAAVGTGSMFDITESGNMTGMTGSIASINASGTNTVGSTGNLLNLNIAGSGQIMKALNITTATTGALANGAVRLNMTGAHTGNAFQIDDVTTTGRAFQLTGSAAYTGTGLFGLTADSMTSGTLATLSMNAITSGTGFSQTSTSTALTTADLMNLDWSPSGSTEIIASAGSSILSLNVGQYGNIDKILNVQDTGSTVFGVGQGIITSALPHEFTAAGDVSVAYDIQFTNQTASYIKSNAALQIESGESFESNNLTLKTYNSGVINLDTGTSATTTGVYLDSGATTSTANGLCHSGADADNAAFSDRQIVACAGTVDADFAEQFPVEEGLELGDVVAMGTKLVTTTDGNVITQLVKSTSAYQQTVIGVISNNYSDFASAGYNVLKEDNPMPVAEVGRVPVKIAENSQPIKRGDYITSSDEPGKAMKADRAGQMIGKALNDWNPGTDQKSVMVYIINIYADPSNAAMNEQLNAKITGLESTLALLQDEIGLNSNGGLEDRTATLEAQVAANTEKIDSIASAAFDENGQETNFFSIVNINGYFQVVRNSTSTAVNQLIAGSRAVFGQLEAGLIKATSLIADNITVNQKLTSNEIETQSLKSSLISPLSSEDLTLKLGDETSSELVVKNASDDEVLSIDQEGNTDVAGNLNTQGNLNVAQDATVSGELTASAGRFAQLQAQQANLDTLDVKSATISGQLYLSDGRSIQAILEDNSDYLASVSAQTEAITQQVQSQPQALSSSSFDDFLSQLTGSTDASVSAAIQTLAQEQNITLEATDMVLAPDAVFVKEYLNVAGYAQFKNANVSSSLTIGNNLILTQDTIASANQTLFIQPTSTSSVNILAGLLVLNPDGNVAVNGNLIVSGDVKIGQKLNTNSIQPNDYSSDFTLKLATQSAVLGESTQSKLSILDANNSNVASIDASGSARFKDLSASGITIAQPTSEATDSASIAESAKNQTAGSKILEAGTTEMTIENNNVSDNVLIYLTPTSDTANQVVYLKSKETCSGPLSLASCQKSFTVGIKNPVTQDITFNYWIVKVQ